MAVTLLIGGDAGVGGDVRVTEPGKTTSSGMGSGSGTYERSEGAEKVKADRHPVCREESTA